MTTQTSWTRFDNPQDVDGLELGPHGIQPGSEQQTPNATELSRGLPAGVTASQYQPGTQPRTAVDLHPNVQPTEKCEQHGFATFTSGIIQVIWSIMLFLLTVVFFELPSLRLISILAIYRPFITGIIAGIAGSFGIYAGRTGSRCGIITTMVMSILAAFWAGAGFIWFTMDATTVGQPIGHQRYGTHIEPKAEYVVITAVTAAVCFIETVVATVQARYTCAICCRQGKREDRVILI